MFKCSGLVEKVFVIVVLTTKPDVLRWPKNCFSWIFRTTSLLLRIYRLIFSINVAIGRFILGKEVPTKKPLMLFYECKPWLSETYKTRFFLKINLLFDRSIFWRYLDGKYRNAIMSFFKFIATKSFSTRSRVLWWVGIWFLEKSVFCRNGNQSYFFTVLQENEIIF